MLLKCLSAIIEGLGIMREDARPVGLRQFRNTSDDELLMQLSRPVMPLPTLKGTFNQRAWTRPNPRFASVQASPFSSTTQNFYRNSLSFDRH